jgi:hypothetical protein
MKYFFSLCLFAWAYIPLVYAQDTATLVNPESINPTTRLLSYKIPAKDITISSYGGAHPSHFKVTLCNNCQSIVYQLKKGALLEYYGKPFDISKLTTFFIKNNFQHVGLGVDRNKSEITRISLEPINNEVQRKLPKLEDPS